MRRLIMAGKILNLQGEEINKGNNKEDLNKEKSQ
jgi:hypothetical protein